MPTGYAVELAALVDTAAALGVDAIGQVDLGRRAHRHQDLLDLGAMATQILAAMRSRQGRPVPEAVTLRQYRPVDGQTTPADRAIAVDERPPAVSL